MQCTLILSGRALILVLLAHRALSLGEALRELRLNLHLERLVDVGHEGQQDAAAHWTDGGAAKGLRGL